MGVTYSTYEAKARFSEVLRRVREGQHVTISYRGEAVAEIRPIYRTDREDLALREMEDEGVLSRQSAPLGRLEPVAGKPGALERFLESRE
jgi:prevent-host-death family protein